MLRPTLGKQFNVGLSSRHIQHYRIKFLEMNQETVTLYNIYYKVISFNENN